MKYVLLITILAYLLLSCEDHSKNEDKINRTDDLFKELSEGLKPGYALGVIENGELVYSQGYGYANLEHRNLLTDTSTIYIGSMAKQFTTAALLILEEEGKVDFSKPVKDYLPDFTRYNDTITVSHLVHHTSGIRETNSMQLFQGVDLQFEEVFDTDDLYQLILKQEKLNFKPGEEYRYSSGGYAVLAKIVEKVSGQRFRDFAQNRIFEKLGMKSTLVCDNHNEIIANRADSYWLVGDGQYERRSQVFDAYGDGGIMTTVKDLVQWDRAFYKDVLGVTDFSSKMYQKGQLNNQEEIEYARALQVRNYKGLQMITHNGGMLGFRVDMVRFPEVQTSFVLLGNSGNLDPTGDILKLADIWLEDKFKTEKHQELELQNTPVIAISSQQMKAYEGYYWTDQTNYYRHVFYKNDSLFFDSGNPDMAHYLIPIGQNEFLIKDFYVNSKLKFNPERKGGELEGTFGNVHRVFRKFDPAVPKHISDLKAYLGRYYSKELSTNYVIYEDRSSVFLKINNKKPIQLFPASSGSRVVWNGTQMVWIGFGELKFKTNSSNEVTGLSIGDSRVSGVEFTKIE